MRVIIKTGDLMKKSKVFTFFYRVLLCVVLMFGINSMLLSVVLEKWYLSFFGVMLFVLANVFPSVAKGGYPSFKFRMAAHGSELLLQFLITTLLSCGIYVYSAFRMLPDSWIKWAISLGCAVLAEFVLFWNGIISVYCSSVQLGIKHRVIGLLCGFIPIANLVCLGIIIKITMSEVNFEIDKAELDKSRNSQKICKTKYPILLVHGVFFRDSAYLNYWGRVPAELAANGAEIYYGNHESAASVDDSAKEIAERIKQIVAETGCEKLNIIAHSKGGLDCRKAIACYGVENMTASLTTINTPHRGCGFADYLLTKVSPNVKNKIAAAYNAALKKFGDKNPDFIAAVTDLTQENCNKLNTEVFDSPKVYYQSFGSRLNRAGNGKFPLNFSYNLVKYFDGANDGLVSENSFPWGAKYTYLTTNGKRGISHGDMIDLNRENIKGFDIREFYVQILADLKKRGY